MMRILALAGLLFFCLPAMADEADLSFNADALRLVYTHPFTTNKLQLDGGWLHDSDNGDVLHVGLNLADVASSRSDAVRAGLGARLAWQNGDQSKQDGFSVPVGGFIVYTPPRYNRVSFGVAAYIAPEVLSLGDAEKFQDYTVRVSYNVLREADIYLGARYVKGEYKKAPDAYYDTGMHVGMTLRF